MSAPPTRQSVLFVCLGNICRSPAAEIIFRHLVQKAGLTGQWTIDSAGTIGYHQGAPPDARMSAALRAKGYDVRGQSRKLLRQDLEEFDWIVTMDEMNYAEVCSMDPEGLFRHKIRPLVGFCQHHDEYGVPDPYHGGSQGFVKVIEMLEDGCAGVLAEFSGNASASTSSHG